MLHALGRYKEAKAHAEIGIELARSLGNSNFYTIIGFFNLGRIAYLMGEYEMSQATIKKALMMRNEWWSGYVAHALGRVEVALGNYKTSETHLQKSLRIFSSLDDQRGVVFALIDLGRLARLCQNYEDAWRCFREAARIADKIRLMSNLLEAIAEAGYLLSLTGRIEQGVEWLTLALNHPTTWQEARDNAARYLVEIQKAHPHLRLTLAQERGSTLDLERIVEWIGQQEVAVN